MSHVEYEDLKAAKRAFRDIEDKRMLFIICKSGFLGDNLFVKKILYFITCIFVCFCLGCGTNSDNDNYEEKHYEVSVNDMNIVLPLSQDGSFYFYDDWCVFHSITNVEPYSIEYYIKNIYGNEEPKALEIYELVEQFITDYLDDYLYILCESKNGYAVKKYETSGRFIGQVEFDEVYFDTYPNLLGAFSNDIWVAGDAKTLMFFDSSGTLVHKLESDKYVFNDIVKCDKALYVVASYLDNSLKETLLLKIDVNDYHITELKLPIGTSAVTFYKDSIYFADQKLMYSVKMDELICLDEFDYSAIGVDYISIHNLFMVDDKIIIIKNGAGGNGIKAVLASPTTKLNLQEVTYLTLYLPNGIADNYNIKDIVLAFNEDNPDIHIDVTEYDKDINYVMAASDRPDLIVNYENSINELGKRGYLLDLSHMLEKSENLSETDFLDGLIETIEYSNGSLYGIPRYIGIRTLGGAESIVGSKTGWTVNEFLDWLIERPETLRDSWMRKEDILRICLEGSLSEFKDDDYTELLQKVNQVTTYYKEGMILDINADIISTNCEAFTSIPSLDNLVGEKFVFKGYPSNDGKPRYTTTYVAAGILESCKNIDAAYRFVEYYVTYKYGERERFYSTKRLMDWARAISGTINFASQSPEIKPVFMTKEQLERPMVAIPYLCTLSKSDKEIIDIIVEESAMYFLDKKTVNETSSIIKQRVGLYREEQK